MGIDLLKTPRYVRSASGMPAQYNGIWPHVMRFRYTETSGALKSIVVPAGTFVYDIGIHVKTLFNSGTNDLLNVGDSGDPDGYVDDAVVKTGGAFAALDTIWLYRHAPATAILGDNLIDTATTNVIRNSNNDVYTSEATLQASVTRSGTAATAGDLYVIWLLGTWHPYDIQEG